jgi:hypothetical protein
VLLDLALFVGVVVAVILLIAAVIAGATNLRRHRGPAADAGSRLIGAITGYCR